MGGTIPHSIKLQVLNDWLSGKSRDDIAINNGISNGTVLNIIKEFKKEADLPESLSGEAQSTVSSASGAVLRSSDNTQIRADEI